MNLWDTLGVSPLAGLSAAAAGLVAAFVVAASTLLRRSRAAPKSSLELHDR